MAIVINWHQSLPTYLWDTMKKECMAMMQTFCYTVVMLMIRFAYLILRLVLNSFYHNINFQHPNIKFTMEKEVDCKLAFRCSHRQ